MQTPAGAAIHHQHQKLSHSLRTHPPWMSETLTHAIGAFKGVRECVVVKESVREKERSTDPETLGQWTAAEGGGEVTYLQGAAAWHE